MKESDLERIDHYLRRQLSTEEAAAFEAKISTDEALAEEVALHRAMYDLSYTLLEERLREKIQIWQAAPPKDVKPFFKKRQFWGVCLLILILLSIGFSAWWFMEQQDSNLQLPPAALDTAVQKRGTAPIPSFPQKQDRHFRSTQTQKPAKGAPLADNRQSDARHSFPKMKNLLPIFPNSHRGDKIEDIFLEGIDSINRKQFSGAVSFFEKMDSSGKFKDNSRGYILYGYACFFNKDYQCASKRFREVLSNIPIFKKEAEWMLALTLFAQNGAEDKEFSRILSEILANKEHPYWQDAQSLYKKMR